MLTTGLVILVLSSSFHPASQSCEGKGTGVKAFHLRPPYGRPVELRLVRRHAFPRTHKVLASDTLTRVPGTGSSASAKQTLYSAEWRKHNYIRPTAYN